MRTLVAEMTIRAGREPEAESALLAMYAGIVEREPATLTYIVHRNQYDSSKIIIYESYDSHEAYKAHAELEHVRHFVSTFDDLFDPAIFTLTRLVRLAGFDRDPSLAVDASD